MVDNYYHYGTVRITKTDKKTGETVFDQTYKNQLTNYALAQAAQAWGQSVNGINIMFPSQISIGTGSPPAGQSGTTPNDYSLWSELSGTRKTVDYAQQWLTYYIQYSVTYQTTEALGTIDPTNNPTGSIAITEAGLWDANGYLWSHVQLNGVTHDNTTTLSIQWQVLMKGN